MLGLLSRSKCLWKGIYPSSIYAWRNVSKAYVDFYEDDSSESEKLFWVQSDKQKDFVGL